MIYSFEPQKFYLLEIFLLVVHLGAIVCAYYTNLSFLIKIMIMSLVIIHYFFANNFDRSATIWHNHTTGWRVSLLKQVPIPVTLDTPVFVANYLVVLNFIAKQGGAKISIPITKHALKNYNDFRKLKSIIKTRTLP